MTEKEKPEKPVGKCICCTSVLFKYNDYYKAYPNGFSGGRKPKLLCADCFLDFKNTSK